MHKMNHITKYLAVCIACLGMTACDSLFDNELPKHDLVGDNAITDEKSAQTALNGVYSFMDDTHFNNGALSVDLIINHNIRLNML